MPAYDSNLFNPSAPLARVILRDLRNGNTANEVPMLIDSGADITLVPKTSIDKLKSEIDPSEGYELKGFDGHRSVAKSVQLDLVFLRRTFRGRFLAVDSEYGILGRDVLNHVSLLLDGPGSSWSESTTGAA
ncbi:MAG TPA: retropepsin-like aspartic protease [Pyrinomonadaceae bacterium]|nr:retropepsin-like aspartic protease [Pyrinomonadaceae bacterium]